LANQDPLRFAEATSLQLRSAFNWLTWKKDEAIKETLAIQKENSIRKR
jgi:hypothetical protein